MSKLQELINKLCPNGVEFKPIWSLTTWDKKFKGVDRKMQPNVISYPYVLANVFDDIEETNGDVNYLQQALEEQKDGPQKKKPEQIYVKEKLSQFLGVELLM